jgi:DNA modification methylase
MAAKAEGFRFIGIELDDDYFKIATLRIKAVQAGLPLGIGGG